MMNRITLAPERSFNRLLSIKTQGKSIKAKGKSIKVSKQVFK